MAEPFENLLQLTEKISLELVYAEPGKDTGLLPVNSLLSEVEAIVGEGTVWEDFTAAIVWARSAVDLAFERQSFDSKTLEQFNEWLQWMRSALQAISSECEVEAFSLGGFDVEAAPSPAHPTEYFDAEDAEAKELHGEDTIDLNLEEDGDLLREFINESDEHLENIEAGVLVLEEFPRDMETLNSIFRAFHTFKGSSGFLNLRPINRLAHALEDLLDLARQSRLEINREVINLILQGGDTLRQFVGEIGAQLRGEIPVKTLSIPTAGLLAKIKAIACCSDDSTEAGEQAGESARTNPHPAADDPAPEAEEFPKTTAPCANKPESVPKSREDTSDTASNSAGRSPAPSAAPTGGSSVVKVDTRKLDALVDLVGEVVIAQSMVTLDPEIGAITNPKVTRNLAQLGRITKELQRIAMSMRMVPIRGTFQKMHRLVRDLSSRNDKKVNLELSGEDTELDRNIVEAIGDPLIHMVRNSVDHGIESTAVREANGKPPVGVLQLRAFHQGGNIVIEIQDDGAGLNRDRILKKAIAKGLIRPEEKLTDKEIFDLIFAAGFSTAERITDISGRGVGMDVVQRNIEKLRGKIEIQSIAGRGATFSIYLPLTLAIIDGLIVAVGDHKYILPTLAVRESFRPTAEMLSTIRERGEVVDVRGRLIPVLRLYEHFGLQPKTTKLTEAICVVVEAGRDTRCLVVDELLGKQEVVIKNLGETFKSNKSLAGSAILGDGRVGLILDVYALVKLQNAATMAQAA